MKKILTALVFVAALVSPTRAADPELAGSWIGAIDTPRGQMEIGLNLTVEKNRLVGVIKTGHGDWPVTEVTEKDGVWTVAFKGPENEGSLTGRITAGKFSGDWKSKMANGTFELTQSKKKQ